MSKYFGAPYAQKFAVPLPLTDCVNLITQQNGKRLQRYLKSKGTPGVFNIVIDVNEIDATQVVFKGYAEYKRFNLFKVKQNTHVYGDIYLEGQCRWEGYQTVVEYDFYHRNDKPLYYDLIPPFLYNIFHRTATYIILFIVSLILVVLIPLSFPILIKYLGLDWLFGGLTGLMFLGSIIPLLLISNLYEGIYPVIQLDNLMRNTFEERDYGVASGTRKKQTTDFYLPE